MRKLKPTAVTVFVERRGKLACLVHYKRHKIEIPGGKIDRGESMWRAASRELYEESGLIATHLTHLDTLVIGDHICAVFTARAVGHLRTSTEGKAFWCSKRRLTREGTFKDIMAEMIPLHDWAQSRHRP